MLVLDLLLWGEFRDLHQSKFRQETSLQALMRGWDGERTLEIAVTNGFLEQIQM